MIAFLVYANADVYLVYNTRGEWVSYYVRAETNYNEFDLDGNQTGYYMCSDSKTGYNVFNEDAEWTECYVK